MTKRQFVVLAFRLFALYLLFNLITSIGSFFNSMTGARSGGSSSGIWVGGFAICIILWLISLLWRKSEWLMQKVFAIPVLSDITPQEVDVVVQKRSDEASMVEAQNNSNEVPEETDYFEAPITMEAIQLVAFSVIGLWVAFNAFPNLIREVTLFFTGSSFLAKLSVEWLIPYLIQIVLGVWLFLRPWQFQGWIEKFKPKEDEMD
jgi:hypothetical protein